MPRQIESRAQQGFLFANNMPFARRWAHNAGMHGGKSGKTAYASLPRRTRRRR